MKSPENPELPNQGGSRATLGRKCVNDASRIITGSYNPANIHERVS